MGISFFKVALLISYLRLFKGTNHSIYRMVVWISMAAIVIGHLGCSLTLILACQPVSCAVQDRPGETPCLVTPFSRLLADTCPTWNR